MSRPDWSRLWYTRCEVPTASGAALHLGWLAERFAADGVTLGVLQDAPPEISGAHYDHSLPTLLREGGNVPAIVTRASGTPTRLIGLTWIDEGQAIVARPDWIAAGHDLRGARIAMPGWAKRMNASHSRAMALQGIHAALAASGLDGESVRVVDLAPQPTIAPGASRRAAGIAPWPALTAVADGVADIAYVKGAAGRALSQRLGLEVLVDIDALERPLRVNNGTPRPLTVHQDLLDHRPEWVIDFLALSLLAAHWAATRPDALAELMAREMGIEPADLAIYGPDVGLNLAPDLSEARLGLLQQQGAALVREGVIAAQPDVANWAVWEVMEAAIAKEKQFRRQSADDGGNVSRLVQVI